MASAKFYFDKRNKKQNGTYLLKLTVTHFNCFCSILMLVKIF